MTWQDILIGDIVVIDYTEHFNKEATTIRVYSYVYFVEDHTIRLRDLHTSIGTDGIDSDWQLAYPDDDFVLIDILAHLPPPDPDNYLRTHHPELFL